MTILHDDALVMNEDDTFAVALEPAYFDKTQDYPSDHPDHKYLLTVQNNAVTLNHSNQKVLINRFEDRLDFIQNFDTINCLPLDAVKVLTTCIEHIKN